MNDHVLVPSAAVHIVAQRGLATGAVRLLVDAGADVLATSIEGTTPLGMASDRDTMRLLISAGAE
jgi:ankyrin repeat protein